MATSGEQLPRFQVRGTVRDETGAPVGSGVTVQVVDLRVGGEHPIGQADVRPDGTFELAFDPDTVRAAPGASLDLVVRVLRLRPSAGAVGSRAVTGDEVIARSAPRFDSGSREQVDVVVPTAAVPRRDEYSRLVADVGRGLAAAGETDVSVRGLVEDDERQDITFAAGKSGWDARSVAMASLATRESAATGIPAPLHYALYRAGLPAGERLWALASGEVVQSAWTRAIEQGIISSEAAADIPAGLETARHLAARAVLDLPTGVSDGRLGGLLEGTLPEETDRQRFAQIFREHRSAPGEMWTQVRQQFPDETAARLELDGALAGLTRNNAPLIAKLHDGPAPARVGDLAAAGYHRAERWETELSADVPVPDDIPGAHEADRRKTYAAALAEELRLRHPTAVLGAEVADGTIPVGGPEGTDRAVAGFLAAHHDQFELAAHPVDEFIAAQSLDVPASVRDEMATLQRIVAVAPAPEAVRGLRSLGFDSARSVAVHGEPAFVRRFGPALGGHDVAAEAFRRSDQVHSATLATATSHLVARAAPEVYAIPRGGPVAAEGPLVGTQVEDDEGDLAQPRSLPNLETLFGPGDTGACEACESVLSPAAYLVDLLEFLDVDPPGGGRRPLEVLLDRRPDLQHLALSCENTEVELPYVDVANEILEHIVVHRSIEDYQGHDVSPGTSTADLLASPQFVDDAAYTALRAASYPLLLPWDQRLAALRAYLPQVGLTLHEALGALAEDEANGRSWSDVVRERVGVGPAERDLLCGATVSPQELYGDAPERVDETQLVSGVGNARRLARRLGLTPTELIALLRRRFLNPDADLLVLVDRLDVTFTDILSLHDGTLTPAAFRAKLPAGIDTAPFGGDVVAWLAARHDRIMHVVVLTDPTGQEPPAGDSTGNFAAMELRRALPDPARNRLRAVDLLGIARFVRLRARLGWNVERTDAVVAALWPEAAAASATADAAEVRQRLDVGFDAVLVRLGHLLTALDELGLDAEADLPWLLGCFAPLAHREQGDPYRALFPALLLGSDPAFGVGPDGSPAGSPGALLLDHGPALQAALKLTADEFATVVRTAGVTAATPLSVASVSQLFRYGYLARTLEIAVSDLVGLIEATGLSPFGPLDGPDPDFLVLIRMVHAVQAFGLPVGRVVALAGGSGAPGAPGAAGAEAAVFAVARRVRAALVDPRTPAGGEWSESALRAVLVSVLAPDEADTFLGLLAGASTYATAYHQDEATLPASVLLAAPGLSYDAARSQLVHRGVLTPEAAAAVTALPDVTPGLVEALAVLVNAGQADYLPLLLRYPVLADLWRVYAATPVDPADPEGNARRAVLGANLVQGLRPELRRRQLGDALAPVTGVDSGTVTALVEDAVALPGSTAQRTAADDLAEVSTRGASVRFWAGAVAGAQAGPPTRTGTAATVDYGPGAADLRGESGIDAGPVSGVWAAHVDPPVTGRYLLSIVTDADAVILELDGRRQALQHAGELWTAAEPVELVVGTPVRVQLTATGLEARLRLRWQSGDVAPVVLPGEGCWPVDAVTAFANAYRRLEAALELMSGFALSSRELLSFARSPAYRIGDVGWLAAVPLAADADALRSFVHAVTALADYRQLRERWSVSDGAIVDILDAAVPGAPAEAVALVAGVTPEAVAEVVTHLGDEAGGLRTLDGLMRAADVLDLFRRVVLPVGTLATALRTTPSTEDVRALRDAVRARYDHAAWDDVVRPIHNQLRRGARDALVAHVLHLDNPDPDLGVDEVTGGFTSPEQLYEKLLIDVQMDPCMTTSRIAQAISTVQLFVARFLLNLEPEVSPQSIDPLRWEAMKHYRVWEANRRVFLFPENWLDPDLRDDKSPFFKQVESELLQSDVTDQAAATALGHYLEQLDEVANLEIAGMHVEERDAAGTGVPDPLVHVIGRTFGAKRSYFHRTLDGTWRPWEPVNVDIQDDPVLPVIWKGRFLLFWLKVSKQPDSSQPGPFGPGADLGSPLGDLAAGDLRLKATAALTVSLFWSEYYNGRWQSPRTSDPDRPIDLGAEFSVIGDPMSLGLGSEIVLDPGGIRDSLGVIVLNPGGTGNSHFRLYTTHSLPVRRQDDLAGAPGFVADWQFTSTGRFTVIYTDDPFNPVELLHASQPPYRGVGPMHKLRHPHEAPFFFQDSRHVFYIHRDPTDPMEADSFGTFPGPVGAPETFPDPGALTDPLTLPTH